jgi:hypothetical protein
MDRITLDSLTVAQHGLFTRTQAATCGFNNHQIARRIREGDWVVVLREVLAERGQQLTPGRLDVAALLTLPDGVLSGPSAARWHSVEVPSTGTYVTVEHDRRIKAGYVHILHDRLSPQDITPVGAIRITGVERTVFDCARLLPDAAATALLAKALEEGWTTLAGFGDRISSFANRHGAPRLVKLLREAAVDNHVVSKRMATKLLQLAGIWGWSLTQPINDRWGLVCLGDIVFPGSRLVLDFSPEPAEGDADGRARDEHQRNRLLASGWSVMRLSWVDLAEQPGDTIANIRMTLDSLGAHAR